MLTDCCLHRDCGQKQGTAGSVSLEMSHIQAPEDSFCRHREGKWQERVVRDPLELVGLACVPSGSTPTVAAPDACAAF